MMTIIMRSEGRSRVCNHNSPAYVKVRGVHDRNGEKKGVKVGAGLRGV